MNFQPSNFDFISVAGQQAGKAVQDYSKAKGIEIDDAQAKKAHKDILDQVSKKYMEATGETDQVKALTFSKRYFPDKYKNETASEAAKRWMEAEPKFEAALKQVKVEKFHADTVANKPQPYTRPEGDVSVQEPRPTAQAGTPEFAKKPTSFDGIAGMQARAMAEPPPQGVTTGPVETSQEMQERANALGVSADESVSGKIQGTQDIEVGQEYTGGLNRGQALAGMAAQGKDVTKGAAKAIGDATPLEQQLSLNKLKETELAIKKDANAINAKFKATSLYYKGRELDAESRKKVEDSQLDAREASTKIDQELAKLYVQMAKATKSKYSDMDPDAVEAAAKAIETLESQKVEINKSVQGYQDILDGTIANILPTGAPTKPAAIKPVALPAGATDNEIKAFQWLNDPNSKSDPNYQAVKDKLAKKYPNIVR
jgi:hypothetical protein